MHNILILANDETTIYNFRREIIRSFCERNFKVYVVYPFGNNTAEIEGLGCKCIDCKVSRHGTNIIEDLKLMFKFVKIIKAINPSVVLTYTVKPNIYGSIACQLVHVPYMNNITGLGSVLQSESLVSKLILFLQKIAYKKSSCVFFQNEDNYKTFLEKKVVSNKNKYEILPGSGVNLQLHKYEAFPNNEFPIKFAFVSRIRKDKGVDELFEAATNVKKKYKDNVEFHIVGWYEEDSYHDIIKKLEENKTIIYHGMKSQEEVHQIIKDCHCLIHPSYHEGMSNVLLEAAAAGRPVIASNIPGCKETFDENESGISFYVKNPIDLERKICSFIELPYEKKKIMGKNGRYKMENEFDRKFVADKYINQIYELLKS